MKKFKKGTKVIFPIWSNDIAKIDFIYPNGKVDIKYTGCPGVVTVQSVNDLIKI